jgi:DNA-binding response OmpR family regulator
MLRPCGKHQSMKTNILIIDDQPDILELMTDVLSMQGFAITALLSTTNIIKTIWQYNPDIVVLDHLLTGSYGGDLCREIKKHPTTAHLPVVLLSGFPRLKEAFGDYGSDAFVAKPFKLHTLTNIIKSCLERKRPDDSRA